MFPKNPIPVWQAALFFGFGVFALNLAIARLMASVLNARRRSRR